VQRVQQVVDVRMQSIVRKDEQVGCFGG
jgi:hypothetical protein